MASTRNKHLPQYTYDQYNDDVLSRNISACKAIYLACKRYDAFKKRDDMYFDEVDVKKKINFIAKMKHTTGVHNKQPFLLLPWQQWCVANIFGFKWKSDNTRVCRNVFMMLSRKSGKTAFASAIGIAAMVADGENGAEIELVANSRQQAHIAFDITRRFIQSIDPNKALFHILRDTITLPVTESKIQVLSSDAMGNDGYNSSVFILDEFHATKTWDLYNVMKSSQGMRKQPLAIIITTAGFLLNGYPCYEHRINCLDILSNKKVDDTQFSAIYELDADDNPEDEQNWTKCCPSLGQTVYPNYIKEQIQSYKNNPTLKTAVLTKNFNCFCQAKTIWISDEYLNRAFVKQFDLNTPDFQDKECFMGVDLSSISDLTSSSIMFPPDETRSIYPDKFIFYTDIYVPEKTLNSSLNSNLYQFWLKYDFVHKTSGNVVDYDEILAQQIKYYNTFDVVSIAYDSWNSTQWAINATTEGLPLTPYAQGLGNFNRPTKYFEMLILQNKAVIINNDCIRWSFNNVELKTDINGNQKPIKAKNNSNNKIDPIISMLQALGAYLDHYKMGVSDNDNILSVAF